jgi:hypothetical protein
MDPKCVEDSIPGDQISLLPFPTSHWRCGSSKISARLLKCPYLVVAGQTTGTEEILECHGSGKHGNGFKYLEYLSFYFVVFSSIRIKIDRICMKRI